jgi:hypothetical protein
MPKGDCVFTSTNNVGTNTRYGKGSTTISAQDEGLCKALAVLWCANMVGGVRDVLSKPDEFRAGSLQVKFETSGYDSDVIFGLAGVKQTDSQDLTGSTALNYIASHPGTYQIRVPGHAIAVHISGATHYFYDSESGLWKYTSSGDWLTNISGEYNGTGTWHIWKLETA